MDLSRVSGLLGLCRRAGVMELGADPALKLVRRGQAAFVLMDETASANTQKALKNAAVSHGAALYVLPGGLLDRTTGSEGRMAAALKKGTLSDRLRTLLDSDQA